MNFLELVSRVNSCDGKYLDIVNGIDINDSNFNQWVDSVFSDDIDSFDMEKLPYLIDELYKSDDQYKFMLCCMLLESTCDKLHFVPALENYLLYEDKFKVLINTLVTIYDVVDNEIANCMALIILNNDPKFSLFDDEQKTILIDATRRKLNAIYNYLKSNEVIPDVFNDLEVIIDLACYMNDDSISEIIDNIDKLGFNDSAELFIIKYKSINNLNISKDKIDYVVDLDEGNLCVLYEILEDLNFSDKFLIGISQEEIARSNMIRWLEYPTEFGSAPDSIDLLGDLIIDNYKFFVYKFSKSNFRIKGDLIGVSGGYPIDGVSAKNSGYTFSDFEVVGDFKAQAYNIINMISKKYKEMD